MVIRKTIQWCVVIVLGLVVAAGGYGYSLWKRTDELLRTQINAKIAEVAPDWDVNFGFAWFDWSRKIHIHNFQVRARAGEKPLFELPEIIVTVDREQFEKDQRVVLQKVVLDGPKVNLLRDGDGRWNWQDLPPLIKTNRELPELEVRKGSIAVSVAKPDGTTFTHKINQNSHLQLVPSGKRKFAFNGRTVIEGAGPLQLDGTWNVDAKTFVLDGGMNDVTVSRELIELIAGFSSELKQRLLAMGEQQQPHSRDAGLPNASPSADPLAASLGFSGTLDVNFRVERPQTDVKTSFKLLVDIKQGQLAHRALPFPLHEVSGKVYCDRSQLILQNIEARNGTTHLDLDASIPLGQSETPGTATLQATDLVLDPRIRNWIPPRWQKAYDPLSAEGRIDVDLALQRAVDGSWRQTKLHLEANRCTAAHEAFPYRLTNVTGSLQRRGKDVYIDLKASAGQQPVTITGIAKNAGPEAETTVEIRAQQIPVDDALIAACKPEIQKTLRSLNLRGHTDAHITLFRPAGADEPYQWSLRCNVADGSMEYQRFPYRLEQLSGSVLYSSVVNVWTFSNISGVHGPAKIAGWGTFDRNDPAGVLDLDINFRSVDIDDQLRHALSQNNAAAAFEQLSPTGRLNGRTKVRWVPNQPPQISLPEGELLDGSVIPKFFRYPLENVHAKFNYGGGKVECTSFRGMHGRTTVTGSASVEWTDAGWQSHVNDLRADNLLVEDRQFLDALPAGLRSAVIEFEPRGRLTLSGDMHLRGSANPNDAVTAAWDMKATLADNSFAAGIDVKKATGTIAARGTINHRRLVELDGRVNLDRAEVWDHELTQIRGPFNLEGTDLTVGSKDAITQVSGDQRPEIAIEQRITARAVNGVLTFDALADVGEQRDYQALVTLSKGDVEEYARRYISGTDDLRGTMNGWVELRGRGASPQNVTGRGQLQISQAALYKLPIIAQIFQALSFVPPDRTFFKYALADFNLRNGLVQFNSIDLAGDAISLRGKGNARFYPPDGQLALEFYAMAPRNQLGSIPIINMFTNEASKALVGIEVHGTVDQPQTFIKPVPQLSNTMQQFLSVLDGRPPGSMPQLLIPPLTFPQLPASFRPQPLFR